MTYKEALEDMCMDCRWYPCYALKNKDHCYSYNILNKAHEQQTPKKPKYKEFGASKYWDCPVCGEVVLSHIDGIPLKNEYNHSHCGGCGQAIDWTEEAEK